jgi:hypothetical protein
MKLMLYSDYLIISKLVFRHAARSFFAITRRDIRLAWQERANENLSLTDSLRMPIENGMRMFGAYVRWTRQKNSTCHKKFFYRRDKKLMNCRVKNSLKNNWQHVTS